ncbi:phosphatidylinositol-specific phospholipase C/glycerophosphodiester phosphodiesterase family protein [Flexivirga meconopsidis]|uniref:phosphatidylinositol-specific phospholipase C/glycerophosphodiester phosphodiesterase family protein n=1 Tax=Flexivirga meconopsidis TaxID=2977121 RepID=UPI00223F8B1B|nr:phosphatidylinositol-specific phospholipase C/glycerophosphodiester phosphodiesterase family protein [Flexivirga meconopsidis]
MTMRALGTRSPGQVATAALPGTHAHGDYAHRRPLWDALAAGFTSIEADLWMVRGQLFIGHSWPNPLRTLRRLYLEPLAELVRETGCIYPGFTDPVLLLIDLKSDAGNARPVIERQLAEYPELFSSWHEGELVPGPVTAVVSGTLAGKNFDAPLRWTGVDGRLRGGSEHGTASTMPLLSDSWPGLFSWNGEGKMPTGERLRLQHLVDSAHARGQQVRFWGTPDGRGTTRDNLWDTLLEAGVDYLNTDDLTGARDFLLHRRARAGADITDSDPSAATA